MEPAATGSKTAPKKLPKACRLRRLTPDRRLRMPPEEALRKIFKDHHDLEKKWFADDLHLARVAPAGTKAVVVLDSLATMSGKYAMARTLHRETWIKRPGICSPKRSKDPDCVLFPIFPMTPGGTIFKPCSLTLKQLEASEAIADEDNKADPERTETFLLKWEEPYVSPWWTPRPLTHDEPRHLVMFKTTLVRYPWMTHFVKMDLDAYPFFPWALPELARPPEGAAAKTGHVYFGQWKKMGFFPGPRNKSVKGIHRRPEDCKIPAGNGGNVAENCWHGVKNPNWGGNFITADFAAVNDGWCNDWSMTDYEKGCFKQFDKGWGLCSGFMYGHLWSYSRSLAQAVVDSHDKYIDSMRGEDLAHSDIRVGAWVNRIALKANESVEVRAGCGHMPWRHFG